MKASQEMRMTYSGLLPQKDGRQIVRVVFERGTDIAEGIVPSGEIKHSKGFRKEELVLLRRYLIENTEDILAKAKNVHPLRNWMGMQ